MTHRSVLSCLISKTSTHTKQKYSFENGEDRTGLKIRKCLIDHQKAGRTIVQDNYKHYKKVSLEAKYEETRVGSTCLHSTAQEEYILEMLKLPVPFQHQRISGAF